MRARAACALAFGLLAGAAAAQDLRGLLPGDPASALAAFGETYRTGETRDGLVNPLWIDAADNTLNVQHEDGGRILLIETWGAEERLGALAWFETPLSEVIARAGAAPGRFVAQDPLDMVDIILWPLAWPLKGVADGYAILTFAGEPDSTDTAQAPPDAVFTGITLIHGDLARMRADRYGAFAPGPGTRPVTLDSLLGQ